MSDVDDDGMPWRTPSRNNGGERSRSDDAASAGRAPSGMTSGDATAASSGSGQKRKRQTKKRRRSRGGEKSTANPDDTTATASTTTAGQEGDDAASTAEPAQWGCPACTFLNDAARRFCEMCGTGNPTKPASETAPSEWSCVACTMKNAPALRACAVCGTINPNSSMPAVLSIARRSLHGGLFFGGAGGMFGDEDEDGDDDDGDDDDSDGSSNSGSESGSGSDDGSSDAEAERRLECPCLECGVTIRAGQMSCPECHAPHPLPRRKLERSDLSSRLHKLARRVAKHDKAAKKKSKESRSSTSKNAYGVSSDVLKKLVAEPKSSKLVDTLQALTHTLAMMDASADSEWGDTQHGVVNAFFVHGFGGGTKSDEGKDPALLGALASILRDEDGLFPAEVRLFAVQSINYILKMDRHLFKREDVVDVVRIYLSLLKKWTIAMQSGTDKRRVNGKDEQMAVEESVNGLCGLCGSEGTMLRELVKTSALNDYLDFLTYLATGTGNTLHSSVITHTVALLQKCCAKIKWSHEGDAFETSSIASAKKEQPALAKRIVDLLRLMLKHPQPGLHVNASKCLMLLFRQNPSGDQQQSVVSTLVTSDVILDLVAVLTSKSVDEPDDSRQAAASLLIYLLDSRHELLETFVHEELYKPLLDGIERLLQQASTSSSLTSHSLKLVSLLIRRVHRTPAAKHSSKQRVVNESASTAHLQNRMRLDSSPDPDVLANLLLDFIRADSIPAVSALIKDGADLNFPSIYDSSGHEIEKPLLVASEVASLSMVRFLVKRGIDVHQLGPSGTALHVAALAGRCDIVSFLLECGASPNDVDREGKSVMKRLDEAEQAEKDISGGVCSPVKKLLDLHQRVHQNGEESDDSDVAEHRRRLGSRRWIFSGENEDGEDEDRDEDDDECYLDFDDAGEDDNEFDSEEDEELSSDEDVLDETESASVTEPPADQKKKNKRRRESVASDNNDGKSAKRRRRSSTAEDENRAKRDASPRRRRSSSDGMERGSIHATPIQIDNFRSTVLFSLLKMLRDVDHKNGNRTLICTLASALEMAPSALVQAIPESDTSLLLEVVNHLLQDPVMFARGLPDDRPTKSPSQNDGDVKTVDKQSSQLLQASQKAMLASYILALRILQAIVRKSIGESSVFYEIERRGICEQIERLHAHSLSTSRQDRHGGAQASIDGAGIFGRGIHLLEFLRSNMVESGMMHLHRLQNMTRRLKELTDTSPAEERDMVLVDLVELFEEENSITSHEFKQSNLLDAILSFVLPAGRTNPAQKRVKLLIDRFAASPSAFTSLIARLQSVVNQEENLPLLSFFTGKGRELYPLTKQLKIVCTRVVGESKDEPRLQKMLQLSALTHFQSFEKTIFRCMPIQDSKLTSFYLSLIGHAIHKAVDGKWKKYWVCGFDQSRCMHLLKPIDDVTDDLVEVVVHDTQFKLSTAVDVFSDVTVDFRLFGDALADNSTIESASNGEEKKRKRQNKKRRKSSISESSGSGTLVEVHNIDSTNAGKLRGAWYAGEIVDAGADSNGATVTKIQAGKAYSVRMLTSGNVLKNIPAEKIRLRNHLPQVGSVVEVDGVLGEITRADSLRNNSENDSFDVRITRDRERKGISKSRIRYPPGANTASSTSSSGVIEAMSLSRLFPARESSLAVGTIGDRVWVSPKTAGTDDDTLVKDFRVAGTIHSFPAGSDSIGPNASVLVEVSFGSSSMVIKVEQSRVINLANGRNRLGSSRLLSALNMSGDRSATSSGPPLHRLLQSSSANNELFSNRPSTGSGSAIDHIRQLLAHSSSSRESRVASMLNASSRDSISATGSALTDEVDPQTAKKKNEDASIHLARVWKILVPSGKKLYSKCIRPPKMSVLIGYERASSLDGIDRRYEEEFGLPHTLFSARRSADSVFGDQSLTEIDSHTGKTVLKPSVNSALTDLFATFDGDTMSKSTKTSKKGKKKQKVVAGVQDSVHSNGPSPSGRTQVWHIDKFSAFVNTALGMSGVDDPEGALVDNCVQFSLFALPSTRRRCLDLEGFLAAVTDMCKSTRNERHLQAFLVSRGHSAASLTGGSVSKRQVDSAAPSSSTVVDPADMKSFPSDQNMLKCLNELQARASNPDPTPPWKLKYYVQCDVSIDWSDVVKREAEPTTTAPQQDSRPAMSQLEVMNGSVSDSPMMKAVRLLSYLYEALPKSRKIPGDVWSNMRLSKKLETQLEDVLSVCSGIYPGWCDAVVSECKFFFPYNLREKLFQATSFGCTRSLHWFRNQLNVDDASGSAGNTSADSLSNGPGIAGDGIYNHEITISPIPKERVKVNRDNLLNSAEAIMKMHGKRKAILDIVFVGEKGYGSGVTAAFYSATAYALQSIEENKKENLRCWVPGIENEREDDTIRHPNGLFPFPQVGGNVSAKLIERFRMMGRLAGKALMDSRLFPLPLSTQFMKLVVGHSVDDDELEQVFLSHGKILKDMKRAVDQLELGMDTTSIQIDGMPIADWLDAVGFNFIDPLSQKELEPKGASKDVTLENLSLYVEKLLSLWLHEGIRAQVDAFREGISEVLPVEKLNLLFVDELLSLLCGDADIAWDVESLTSTMKLAHGYTKESLPVQYFVESLAEMTVPQRREFLLYATGCPNLPAGGFGALRPPFEVVRRVVDTDNVDQALPFARTCTNTLHLPAYSSKQVLDERLRYAIANSAGVIDRD